MLPWKANHAATEITCCCILVYCKKPTPTSATHHQGKLVKANLKKWKRSIQEAGRRLDTHALQTKMSNCTVQFVFFTDPEIWGRFHACVSRFLSLPCMCVKIFIPDGREENCRLGEFLGILTDFQNLEKLRTHALVAQTPSNNYPMDKGIDPSQDAYLYQSLSVKSAGLLQQPCCRYNQNFALSWFQPVGGWPSPYLFQNVTVLVVSVAYNLQM